MRFAKPVKLYRKLRFSKGYGVHSPFVFNLIDKVIEEKAGYYVFDEIERFRIERDDGDMAAGAEIQHRNYGALLFRLVRYFNCSNVLQIGASTGVMSLYLASAYSGCKCYVLDGNPDLTYDAGRFAAGKGIDNLHFIEGDYSLALDGFRDIIPKFDMIFVNCDGNEARTHEAISRAAGFISENTVLIIDGISRNKGMKRLWESMENMPGARVRLDLYALGIVLFTGKLNKQSYKIYFDYGKKRNLYRKGRRRTYFARWR
jgi:predicted O-methyltransferase YrrM